MTESSPARPRRTFTPEFKADAVRLATTPGTTIAQTARDLRGSRRGNRIRSGTCFSKR